MFVSNFTPTSTNYYQQNRAQAPKNAVNFGGRVGYDKFVKDGVRKLCIYETAFFREPKTLQTATTYLKHTFGCSTKKNVLVGACSSGEEAVSYGMLLDGNARVLGFDLSSNIIDKANTLRFEISAPATKELKEYYDDIKLSAYKDSYLGFSEGKLSLKEKMFKGIFDKFFSEYKPEKAPAPKGFWQRFWASFSAGITRTPVEELNTKVFELNKSALDCEFKVGDVLDIETLAEPNSMHLFSFRNAMYHLVTKDLQFDRSPVEKKQAREIFEKIVKGARNVLVDDGLFVFGEGEKAQLTDTKLLGEVLSRNGFARLKVDGKKYDNIWRKIPDKKKMSA